MKYTNYIDFRGAIFADDESIKWAHRYDREIGERILRDFHARWLAGESQTNSARLQNFVGLATGAPEVKRANDDGDEWAAYVTQTANCMHHAMMERFLVGLSRADARALQRMLDTSITSSLVLYPGLEMQSSAHGWRYDWERLHPDEEPLLNGGAEEVTDTWR